MPDDKFDDNLEKNRRIKTKKPRKSELFGVEPRRIEPLNPSVNHRLPHQKWPLRLHEVNLSQGAIKIKKAREKSRTFRMRLQSVVDVL